MIGIVGITDFFVWHYFRVKYSHIGAKKVIEDVTRGDLDIVDMGDMEAIEVYIIAGSNYLMDEGVVDFFVRGK